MGDFLMKSFMLVLTTLALFTSCTKTGQNPSQISSLQLHRSQRNIISLPEEDLQLLKNHDPQILTKIRELAQITIDDIIVMQQLGFTSDMLILIINYTESRFQLSTIDVLRLQAEGVSFKVINYMIRT